MVRCAESPVISATGAAQRANSAPQRSASSPGGASGAAPASSPLVDEVRSILEGHLQRVERKLDDMISNQATMMQRAKYVKSGSMKSSNSIGSIKPKDEFAVPDEGTPISLAMERAHSMNGSGTGAKWNKSGDPEQKLGSSEIKFRTVSEDDVLRKAQAVNMEATWSKFRTADLDDGRGASIYKRLHHRARAIVKTFRFEALMGCIIMTNAVFIGLQVEYDSGSADRHVGSFVVIQTIYALIFLLELLLRILAEGKAYLCGEDYLWNVMDVIIVICTIWETIVVFVMQGGGVANNGYQNTGAIRIFRIVRVARLVRVTHIARVVRVVKALRLLIQSIGSTVKSLAWAIIMMMLIIYVFAILFTQAASEYLLEGSLCEDLGTCGNHSEEDDTAINQYWGSLPMAMLTLFKTMSGGVTWEDAVDPLFGIHWALVGIFAVYIAFTVFAFLNVVTAVFCQSAMESAQRDQDVAMQSVLMNRKESMDQFAKLFESLDVDKSGTITATELEERLKDNEVRTFFLALDLDVQDAWSFFKLLDADAGNSIDIGEFLLGCLKLRGSAKALDFAKLTQESQFMNTQLTAFMKYVESQFETIRAELDPGEYDEDPDLDEGGSAAAASGTASASIVPTTLRKSLRKSEIGKQAAKMMEEIRRISGDSKVMQEVRARLRTSTASGHNLSPQTSRLDRTGTEHSSNRRPLSPQPSSRSGRRSGRSSPGGSRQPRPGKGAQLSGEPAPGGNSPAFFSSEQFAGSFHGNEARNDDAISIENTGNSQLSILKSRGAAVRDDASAAASSRSRSRSASSHGQDICDANTQQATFA